MRTISRRSTQAGISKRTTVTVHVMRSISQRHKLGIGKDKALRAAFHGGPKLLSRGKVTQSESVPVAPHDLLLFQRRSNGPGPYHSFHRPLKTSLYIFVPGEQKLSACSAERFSTPLKEIGFRLTPFFGLAVLVAKRTCLSAAASSRLAALILAASLIKPSDVAPSYDSLGPT